VVYRPRAADASGRRVDVAKSPAAAGSGGAYQYTSCRDTIHIMRTNIVLEDALVEKARKLTGLKTKRAVVEEGLRTLIRLREQEKVRDLFGKLHWEGDLEALREGRVARDHR
jgi:Arc/MetJ family transcription regulator